MDEKKIKIICNNVPRDIIHGFDLTEQERQEFDYLEGEDLDCHSFFRYRGEVYDMGEFVRIVPRGSSGSTFCHYDHSGDLSAWHGIKTDSFFSGILVRFVDDNDRIIVASFYC